jgi:hypothetical protein
MELALPDYAEIKDLLCTQYFTPHGIGDPGISRSYNSFASLIISDKNKKYDQVMCMLSERGIEDRIFFYYSNKAIRVIEKSSADTIIDGKKYTRIYDIDCAFKAGWNLIWEHLIHTVTGQSDCVTRQRRADVEHIPQNIRWKCLNYSIKSGDELLFGGD